MLDNKTLYSSAKTHDFMSSMLKSLCRDFNVLHTLDLSIRYSDTSDMTACTDGQRVIINPGHPMFAGTPEEMYSKVNGAMLHEFYHVVYTYFGIIRSMDKAIRRGRFYPCPPEVEKEQEDKLKLAKELIELRGPAVFSAIKTLENVLEDGRIEWMGQFSQSRDYPLPFHGLELLRKEMYEEARSLDEILSEVASGKLKSYPALVQLMLHYARFAEIKGYDAARHSEEPLVKAFISMCPFMDTYLKSRKYQDFINALNILIVELSPFLSEYIDEMEDEMSNSGDNADKSSSGESEAEGGTSGSSPSNSEEDNSSDGSTPAKSEKEKRAKMSRSELSELADAIEEEMGKLDMAGVSEESSSNPSCAIQDGTEDPPRIPYSEGEASGLGHEETIKEEEYALSKAASDISRIMKDAEDREKRNAIWDEVKNSTVDSVVTPIKTEGAHKGVSIELAYPKADSSAGVAYEHMASELKPVTKLALRKSQNLFDVDAGEWNQTGRYCGNKFRAVDIAKGNGKYFSKTFHIEEVPEIEVALLVDLSGSMSGMRIEYARTAAIMLYEYCEGMGFPISVYGHDADFGEADFRFWVFCDAEAKHGNDKHRIACMQAGCNNRDGLAIKMAGEKLSKSNAETKILFIISDGQPHAAGYHGAMAEDDMRMQIKALEKQDVNVIAAGIGPDNESLCRIYEKKRFLDIEDMEKLPAALTTVIKRFL